MSFSNPADIRNVALCGHGSSGKTTLVDKMAIAAGAVNGPASVDDGTSICDFDEIEKRHKYSVESSFVHFQHAGKSFHVVDTPGYPDFIAQAIGALRAVDTACIVINAHAGIEVNTRRVFHEAGKAGVGRILVINKMDTDNLDVPTLLQQVKELFGNACVPLNVPLGHGADFRGVVSTLQVPDDTQGAIIDPKEISEPLLESIIEVDEQVMERYFEGQQPTDEELSKLIVRAVAEGTLVPILFVSGKTEAGLKEMMDALSRCGLPADAIDRKAIKNGDEVTVKCTADGPLVAQVVKTRIDPFVQKLSFVRIFSGSVKKDEPVPVSSAKKPIKLSQLFLVQGNETAAVEAVGAGGIFAVAKIEDLHTGTSLGEFKLPPIRFPTPMVGLAVSPKSRGDEAKLSTALHKIVEEDPAIRLDRDAQTKELVMNGMSELHLQIIQERLKGRDKVEVDTREPKIPYRETIQGRAEGSYRHKKQTGGRGQFGEVHIRMVPFPEGAKPEEFATKDRFPTMKDFHYDEVNHFMWVDSIVGGTIPSNFLPAVEKGFRDRLSRGVIAGHQVQNIAVEVYFGKHHPVDSSEAAFKTAGSMAFRDVFLKAQPSLLEPIVTLHVTVPGSCLGDINSDLSGRRGRVLGMESAGGDLQTITAEVPLAEVTTYARSLSSMTGGQGSYTMDFARYDVVPGNVQKEIMEAADLKEEEED